MGDSAQQFGLGRIGIWSSGLHASPEGRSAAAELEALGFRAVWNPGAADDRLLAGLDALLDQTSTLVVASGILNIWMHEPADVARWLLAKAPEQQARLLLGLGVSHSRLIGENWGKPLSLMRAYLDGLEADGVSADRLCLAALGPKMLELAASRTAGAHPYMVSTRHTGFARAIMGPDALLAPEQTVIFERDPAKAREIARKVLGLYLRLPNYTNAWRRDGFTDAEIETLDDRLIDDLIVWGDLDAIAKRVETHIAAGADHVCLQVIGPNGVVPDIGYNRRIWKELAKLL